MDLNAYFADKRVCEAELRQGRPHNVVYITSLFHRDRNSTAGTTVSASCANAARVITDGTHRIATPDEIKAFQDRQQEELRRNTVSEQMNKRQFFVVLPNSAGESMVAQATDPITSAMKPGGEVMAGLVKDRTGRNPDKKEEGK
jgi:hypothetical protein